MARRRFFVPEVRRGAAELTGADAEHLVRVLRVEAGQVFEISDNHRVYLAEVESARKSAVQFRITEELQAEIPGVAIALCPALIKFDHFELLVEKATELGVSAIHPFAAVRSEHGLLQAARKRVERWRRIALEASQQSRRAHLPEIYEAADSLRSLRVDADVRFFLDEEARDLPLLTRLPEQRRVEDRVALLVGPEGGWTDPERAAAQAAGWTACGLFSTILRAETAALAGIAVLQAAWSSVSVISTASRQ